MAAVSLSVSTVKPLGDRVFVKVSASEEQTPGGIFLPDAAKEKQSTSSPVFRNLMLLGKRTPAPSPTSWRDPCF